MNDANGAWFWLRRNTWLRSRPFFGSLSVRAREKS